MPEPLWKDDRPPTKGELEHYLTNVLGIPDEDAHKLVSAYNDEPGARPGRDSWTPESLAEYVDGLVAAWRRDDNDLRSEGGAESDREAQTRTGNARAQVAQEEQEDAARDAEGRQQRDAASQAVLTVRESTYSRARSRWVTDISEQLDVSQSLASGVIVGPNGQPILDPNTGEPIQADSGTIFEAVKGMQFDMGRLSFDWPTHRGTGPIARDPRSVRDVSIRGIEGSVEDRARPMYSHRSADALAAGASRQAPSLSRGRRPARSRYVTPSQALNLLSSMSEDDLTSLQQKMFDAGLYDAVAGDGEDALPDWGRPDPLTRRAFMQLFVEASQRSGDSIDRVIADLQENHLNRSAEEGGSGSGGGGGLVVDIPAFEPKVMSKETLGAMVDDLAQDMLGGFVPEEKKQSLIAQMQDRELGVQRRAYDQSVADIRGQARQQQSAATGGAGNDIDAFMNAIQARESQSSGGYVARNRRTGAYGKYQIMPQNWGPWAQRAGLGRNAPQTPENQEYVARTIMLDYYQRFGNWRDVAIAWFAGPGAVGRPGAENRSDGNMTVRAYANEVVNRMGAARGPLPQGGIMETGGQIHSPMEEYDPQAELRAAIKAGDPLGFESHEFADRAIEFFSLLAGM